MIPLPCGTIHKVAGHATLWEIDHVTREVSTVETNTICALFGGVIVTTTSFDSSSLIQLMNCQTPGLLERFDHRLQSGADKILISPGVLMEIADGEREERIRLRLELLGKWWQLVGDRRFIIAPDIHEILAVEFDHPLMDIPLCAPETIAFWKRLLTTKEMVSMGEYHERIKEMKNAGLSVDRSVHSMEELQIIIRDPTLLARELEYVRTYRGPNPSFDWLLQRLLSDRSNNLPKIESLNAAPERYRAARLTVYCTT